MNSHLNKILDKHFENIEKIVLSRQNPITGLLPASTAINAHGDYTDAWVRDNVYSILCVWGLSLSYKKYKPNNHRTYLLSQSVVKLMRGLLTSMMKQSSKVETFKNSLNLKDALHAKYSTTTGLTVVADDEWGHLQLDATSLYLLMLAQMIASGLKIIYTIDEVNFIQNLVHYISRTYCTADFGIWERGNKINHGDAEINCSSVGMAKAALEALSNFNLFGNVTSKESMIHVIPSDIARSRSTLKALLPRESNSKETDAALLSIVGYPAYAIEDEKLVELTKEKIVKKLEGNYGCKRFLLDGHQSCLEDSSRLHYESSELKEFKNIESEWPLFFTYLLLDALMRKDNFHIEYYKDKLQNLFVEQDGQKLLPELYYVPKELIELEKQTPQSQKRVPNENIPLVWAQSLYILSDMINDEILNVSDIDPLSRRKRVGFRRTAYPMVAFLSQNKEVQQKLLNLGFDSETIDEVKPVKILHAFQLSEVHSLLGINEKLGLTGRPKWMPRSITTARLHILAGKRIVFLPHYFNPRGFYLSYDSNLLVQQFKSTLKYLSQNWDSAGQPIVPFLIRSDMLDCCQQEEVLKLLNELQSGVCDGVEIKIGKLEQLLTTASIERIDNLHGYELKDFEFSSFESEYMLAKSQHNWKEVRVSCEEKEIYDQRLEDALLEIIIRQRVLAVGRSYSFDAILQKPLDNSQILEKLRQFSGNNTAEMVVIQEIILHLGHLIRSEPKLFEDMITLRPWYFVQLIVSSISKKESISMAQAYEFLIKLSPHEIYENLRQVLTSYRVEAKQMIDMENLHTTNELNISFIEYCQSDTECIRVDDWEKYRKEAGMLFRLSREFYKGIWYLLQQCKGLVIGDKYNIENSISSDVTLESTAGERNFDLKIDSLLQKIEAPEYRQLNVELLESLIKLFKNNPEIKIEEELLLDVLIGHAVRIAWIENNGEENYQEFKTQAWEYMYKLSPQQTHEYFIKAFKYLLTTNNPQ